MRWDPAQYSTYASERERPLHELVARIACPTPRRVIDLGCGPGTTTAWLKSVWPDAEVEGLDSSREMIAAALPLAASGVSFRVDDVTQWTVPTDADVVVCNAVLQWVDGHLELMSRWAASLPAGGWLAVQVPGNFAAPTHAVMRELAASPRWRSSLAGVLRHHDTVHSPERYATTLQDAGLVVDAWETTYVHVLTGEDPVVEWLLGTGLRPVLAALDAADTAEFLTEFTARMRAEYTPTVHGTLLPYRRIFTVAHRA